MAVYIGVDGASDGWLAVIYNEEEYCGSKLYKDEEGGFESLWDEHGDEAEKILVDIPIGLPEGSGERRCDERAEELLDYPRAHSVFSTPIRKAVYADSYEKAKEIQEEETDRSLSYQAWSICDDIQELDILLRDVAQEAQDIVYEAHPEVCFWALNDEEPMQYSKNQQPAGAFWERVDTLERAHEEVLGAVREAGTDLDTDVSNDDIADAFALALTASPLTGDPQELGGEEDPKELPMKIVYAYTSER